MLFYYRCDCIEETNIDNIMEKSTGKKNEEKNVKIKFLSKLNVCIIYYYKIMYQLIVLVIQINTK